MPRTKEFDEQVVVTRAMRLFWEKGYGSTSVQDLVDHMGINRFSIYSTFGDKRGLFLAALERYRATVLAARQAELNNGRQGLGGIRGYFDRLVEGFAGPEGWKGCLLVNTSVEMAAEGGPVTEILLTHERQLRGAFLQSLLRARQSNELISARDPADLAAHLTLQDMGLGVLAKARPSREELRRRVEVALSPLYFRAADASIQ
jgi:TetR/AcrR family transcriptional repressor of nem operon